jgi:hypothetical protein
MCVSRRDGAGNSRRIRAQPTHSTPAAYFLHAVEPVHNRHACTPDPRSLVGSRDPGPALQRAVCRGPSHWPAGYKLPGIPVNLQRKLLLTE